MSWGDSIISADIGRSVRLLRSFGDLGNGGTEEALDEGVFDEAEAAEEEAREEADIPSGRFFVEQTISVGGS